MWAPATTETDVISEVYSPSFWNSGINTTLHPGRQDYNGRIDRGDEARNIMTGKGPTRV